jgi:hypothetical protein
MSDGALVFNLQRGQTLKRSTVSPHAHREIRRDVTNKIYQEQMGGIQAIQVKKEVYTQRDEEAGTTLSQTQAETKYSMDTASSSKAKEAMENLETV